MAASNLCTKCFGSILKPNSIFGCKCEQWVRFSDFCQNIYNNSIDDDDDDTDSGLGDSPPLTPNSVCSDNSSKYFFVKHFSTFNFYLQKGFEKGVCFCRFG
jgi:hypothetical protein